MSEKTSKRRKLSRNLISVAVCLIMAASLITPAAAVVAVDLIVLGEAFTRAEIAALPVAEGSYTYTTRDGERTDTVRGALLSELLAEVDDDAVVAFSSVDNWDGMSAYTMTKGELVELNAMIAYAQKDGDDWEDYLRETDDGEGYFALYVDGMRVAHAVNAIYAAMPLDTPVDGEASTETWIGDASPYEHDFRIVGMVEQPGYFTMEGFIEAASDYAQTKEYNWLNSSGSADIDTFTGIYIEDLLKNIMSLADGAAGIIVTAGDGYNAAFALDDNPSGAYWTDIDGNQMMLVWNGTESRTVRDIVDFDLPRVIIGQTASDNINRSSWVQGAVEIRVTAFTDLRGFGWAVPAIDALFALEIVNGMGDGLFAPSESLNRAMFVTMLGRGLNPDAGAPEEEDRRFPDVDYTSWYGMHVEWAVENGIVQGYDDGTFRPTTNLTVAHMLLMAERAGLEAVPEGIDAEAQRFATRAEAAVIVYALMTQG